MPTAVEDLPEAGGDPGPPDSQRGLNQANPGPPDVMVSPGPPDVQGNPGPPDDSDGLSVAWENSSASPIDINTDGSTTGLGETEGNDTIVTLGPTEYSPSKPSPLAPLALGVIVLFLFLLLIAFVLNANNQTTSSQGGGQLSATATSQGGGQLDVTATSQGGGQLDATATSSGGGKQTQGGGAKVTSTPAECTAGWLPASGCTCCGTTLTCADGTVAQFNPKCGVGGGNTCKCACTSTGITVVCTNSCTGAACTP